MFKSEETFNCGDSNFLVSKDELVALRWKDSKLGILLSNSMDPSNLNSVEQQQKGKLKKLRVMCPAIIKEHNSREWGRHRSSYRRCSVKKLFLEISQNSQENSCAKACRFWLFLFFLKLIVFFYKYFKSRLGEVNSFCYPF